jgi:uncharacterized repeat protein (TIGR01451 family)
MLGVERLESRTLMSVNVLPSIAGIAYHDLTQGGITSEVGLAGATINLYRDGGDGQFEGKAAGDDTLVGTATTDANGKYRFDNLSAGTYFVEQLPVPGIVLSGQGVATVTIGSSDLAGQPGTVVDSFDATSQMVSDSQFGGRTVSSMAGMNIPVVGGTGVTSTLVAPEAVGGYRTLFVQRTSTHGSIALGANANMPGALEFDSGAASNGLYWITWDGNASTFNPTGLGQLDLTGKGASTGLEMNLGADHDSGYVLVQIYSDANDWSWASVTIPNSTDGSLGQNVFVPWTSFTTGGGNGANFAKVGAVKMEINGVSAADGQVGEILALGPKVFTQNFTNVAQTDLAIVKTGSPSPVKAGGQLVYTFTATNNGPSAATGVTVADTLPAALSFVSSTSSQGTLSYAGGVVTVSLGSMASGATATATLTTTVAASATGSITNTTTISGNETDPNLANNTSTVTTPVDVPVVPQDQPDVAIVKTATPDPVSVGANLTYTLTVSNNALSAATGVTVADTLPTGVTFVSATASQGSTPTVTGGVLNAALGAMAKNSTATVTFVVNVTPNAGSTITNTAAVTEDQVDADPSNNTSTVVTHVIPRVIQKWMYVD